MATSRRMADGVNPPEEAAEEDAIDQPAAEEDAIDQPAAEEDAPLVDRNSIFYKISKSFPHTS